MSKFHNFWLKKIKEESKASFVGWETENNVVRLKIIINGEVKYLSISGGFSGVNIETYTQLIAELWK